jgi:protein SCO1/2
MTGQRPVPGPDATSRIDDGAFRIVVLMVLALVVLVAIRVVLLPDAARPAPTWTTGGGGTATPAAPSVPAVSPTPVVDLAAFLLPDPAPAPALDLTGPGGDLDLAALHGRPVLVFFGYTHCPDVCPATIGAVGVAMDAYEPGAEAVFVSVDPERDTPEWLAEYVAYMPEGFRAVSGTPARVRAAADAWGVQYARVEAENPDAYLMSHTADVFLVDAAGMLVARFPFGTEAPTMTAVIDAIDPPLAPPTASPEPAPTPTPGSDASPAAAVEDLEPVLVSSSVWAGAASPVILTLDGDAGAPATVTAQLATDDGVPVGAAVPARAVRPSGIEQVSYVAVLDIPSAGPWQVVLTATDTGAPDRRGTIRLTALDQGGTAALGAPAPTIRTDTPSDVGGNLTWLTTDPLPDPRLYATSTADALASGRPFVFVVDSFSFKVTPQCGQAVVLAKRLVDRWREVPFIHHEPYRYEVITTEPVIEGSLEDPRLTDVAEAWGVGSAPWGVASMPWLFVVDGDGIVVAKYRGIMGSADVDVMLSLLAAGS